MRFIGPVRPSEAVVASGELTSNRRGKLFEAKAELRNQAGVVLATAAGKHLPIKEVEVTDMVTDFIGDPSWVFGAGT